MSIDKYQKYIGSSFDDVILEIKSQIKNDDLILRTWGPNTVGTMEFNTERLNIVLDKQDCITKIYLG